MASLEQRNGRWMVRWRLHGKQRTKTFDSFAQADAHRISVESDLVTGKSVDPQVSATRFDTWARSWNDNRHGLRESTKARNKIVLESHLIPEFGKARLDSITQRNVQEFITKIATQPRDTGKPLAPATVREIYQELAKCLAAAVAARYLRDSPCVGITLPKVEREDMLFLTSDQVHDFAEAILPRYRALIYVLAYCGLRIGEASALIPLDIDLDKKVIRVSRTASEIGSKMITNAPKTKAGRRSVPMPTFVADELRHHMDTYPAQFVFTGRQGGQIRANAFRQRAFTNGKKKAGLPSALRIHDLRHTAVSLWINNGVDLLRIKTWAGHGSSTFTLDRYGHLYENDDSAILGTLDQAIRKRASDVQEGP